jgi:hypothetical protein
MDTGRNNQQRVYPKLKNYNIDANQMVTSIYKHADGARLTARAATKLYEQQLYLQTHQHELTSHHVQELLEDTLEGTKRLAILSWTTAKTYDDEARELTFKAIRPLPTYNIWEKRPNLEARKRPLIKTLSNNTTKAAFNSQSCELQLIPSTSTETEDPKILGHETTTSEVKDQQILGDGVEVGHPIFLTIEVNSTISSPPSTSTLLPSKQSQQQRQHLSFVITDQETKHQSPLTHQQPTQLISKHQPSPIQQSSLQQPSTQIQPQIQQS